MPASAWRITLVESASSDDGNDRGVELVRFLPARVHHRVETAAERPSAPAPAAVGPAGATSESRRPKGPEAPASTVSG